MEIQGESFGDKFRMMEKFQKDIVPHAPTDT